MYSNSNVSRSTHFGAVDTCLTSPRLANEIFCIPIAQFKESLKTTSSSP